LKEKRSTENMYGLGGKKGVVKEEGYGRRDTAGPQALPATKWGTQKGGRNSHGKGKGF